MNIAGGGIRFACTKFGAKAVLEAAYKRMAGDHRALLAVGLPDVKTFAAADCIGQFCYRSMTTTEREAALADIAVALGRRRKASVEHRATRTPTGR